MLALLELLVWIADIATLDLKTMKPVARWTVVIMYGAIGILFLCGGLIPLFDRDQDGWKIAGGLVISAIGLGLLVRIGYGLGELRRLNREPN